MPVNRTLTTVLVPLVASSREELTKAMASNNLAHNINFAYRTPQLESTAWVTWFDWDIATTLQIQLNEAKMKPDKTTFAEGLVQNLKKTRKRKKASKRGTTNQE